MSLYTNWELPQRIIALSKADTWDKAVKEWEIESTEMLDPGEYDECLCKHYPIRELCHIFNTKTGKSAIVGNHCIKKFENNDEAQEVFGKAPRIFDACKRILKNPSAHANEPLIELAEKKGIFNANDAEFYLDVHRKRNLSMKQEDYIDSLNRKLLYGLILNVRSAYQRLKLDNTESAGPKLAKYAYKKGVIKEQDHKFYSQIWSRAHSSLSDKQQKYKIGLNDKIIKAFDGELDSTTAVRINRDNS